MAASVSLLFFCLDRTKQRGNIKQPNTCQPTRNYLFSLPEHKYSILYNVVWITGCSCKVGWVFWKIRILIYVYILYMLSPKWGYILFKQLKNNRAKEAECWNVWLWAVTAESRVLGADASQPAGAPQRFPPFERLLMWPWRETKSGAKRKVCKWVISSITVSQNIHPKATALNQL